MAPQIEPGEDSYDTDRARFGAGRAV